MYFIDSQNKELLNLNEKKFFLNDSKITLKEFSKEFFLPIYLKILKLQEFEKINQEWLNTKEGKEIYEQVKISCKENKFNYFYNFNDNDN